MANIAKHPINSIKGKTREGVFPKGNKVKKEDPLPKFTMATGVKDNQNAQGKGDEKRTSCPCCSQPHPLHRCSRFKEKTQVQRNEFVKIKGLCYNCLKDTPIQQNGTTVKYIAKRCPSKFKCKVEGCGAQHHTLLHVQKQQKEENDQKPGNEDGDGKQTQYNPS